MDAITAYDLSKQYGDSIALCGLNLQIPEGAAFACVGGQGSGKTTLIRLLSGLCRPTMGECTVLGLSPFFEAEKLHALAGTVLDTARLYETMTLSENLRFFAGINGVEENDAIDRISFLLHRLDIWESRDGKIDDLPTGVVRRASLARALIHRPRVLLMDEPDGGLDQETAQSVQSLISQLVSQEGMTFLLCTRNMAYAQRLCDRFAVLKDGSLLAKGDLESLRKGAGVRWRAILRLAGEAQPPRGFREKDGLWQKEIASEEEMPRIISQAVENGIKLLEARVEEPTLEEIYTAFLEGGRQRAGAADEQDDEYDEYQDGKEDAAGEARTESDLAGEDVPTEDGFAQRGTQPEPEDGGDWEA